MNNRTRFLIFAALILGAVYAYKFTDWFEQKEIQIKYRSLPDRNAKKAMRADPITFYLDKEYKITSLKIISVDEAATNKYPHAYWHLVSESNSVSITDFVYGVIPAGLKPKIAGMTAEPLQRSSNYRLFIEAGKFKGEKDFKTN
jgi:hypothetical protein